MGAVLISLSTVAYAGGDSSDNPVLLQQDYSREAEIIGEPTLAPFLQQHEGIQTSQDFQIYSQQADHSLPLPEDLAANTIQSECTDYSVELIPAYGEPDDIWEQRKNPSTGKVFAPQEPLLLRFNHPVDSKLFDSDRVLLIESRVPHSGGKDYDCSDPNAASMDTLQDTLQYTASNYAGLSDTLILRHPDDLFKAGCKYSLEFGSLPVNKAKQCVAYDSKYREIWIASDTGTRFSRETMNVRYDRAAKGSAKAKKHLYVTSFDMKLGVTLTPDEMWLRYKNELGLQDYHDQMKLLPGYPKGSLATFGVQYSYYQQEYLGVPVEDGSFLVRTNYDGDLVSVVGSIHHNIDIDTEPQISAAEAKASALFQVAAEVYGWEADHSIPEPRGHLMIVFPDGDETPRLVWRFLIDTAIPFDSYVVDVAADNESGEIVSSYSNTFLQDTTGEPGTVDGDTLLESARDYGIDTQGKAKIMYPNQDVTDLWDQKVTLGEDYFLLRSTRWFPLETLYDVDNHLTAIFNQDNNFDEVNERAGASVQWAILKILDYLYAQKLILGPEAHKEANEAGDQYRIEAVVSSNGKRFSAETAADATLGTTTSYTATKKVAGKNEYDFLFRLANQELRAAVAPDVVAHEFCHVLMHLSMGDYQREGDTPSIVEGICDTFAALMEFGIRDGQGDWCQGGEIRLDDKCIRNLAAPWDGAASLPSTLDSPGYNAILEACEGQDPKRCGHHAISTVISHAFYLMAEGGSGQNEIDCSYDVSPLSPNNPEQSRQKLLKILWKVMQDRLPKNADYQTLRYATLRAAQELFPVETGVADEVKTVSAAWEAVGLSGGDMTVLHYPPDSDDDVYPWPAQFLIRADGDSIDKPWQGQVRIYYDDRTETIPLNSWTKTVDGSGNTVLASSVYLDTYANYYWRFRQSDDPQAEWSECMPEQWFMTSNPFPEQISPVTPVNPPANAAYGMLAEVTFPWAETPFIWKEVDGATRYSLVVSTDPNITCEMTEAGAQSDPTHFVDPNIPPGQIPYKLPIRLMPATDYYWTVRAFHQSGDHEWSSDCGFEETHVIAHFKTENMSAPELVSPADNETAYYTDDMTFHWSEVSGANYYQIRFDAAPGGFKKEYTTEANPGATTINVNTSDIDAIELSNTEGVRGYTWRVHAIGVSGQGTVIEGPDSAEGYFMIRRPAIRVEQPKDPNQFTTDGNQDVITWLADWPPGYDVEVRKGSSYYEMNQLYFDTVQINGNKRHVLHIPTQYGKFYTIDYTARPRNANVAQIPLASGGPYFEMPPAPEEESKKESTTTTTQNCTVLPAATITSLQPNSSVQMISTATGTYSPDGTISFSWAPVTGAKKYRVIISDGNNISIDAGSQDNITGTTSDPFQLSLNYPYYVSVRSINECGQVSDHDGKALGFWLYQ